MSVVTAGGSHESRADSLALPPPRLDFLTSSASICRRGPEVWLLVRCEVSLSPALTPRFVNSSAARRLGGRCGRVFVFVDVRASLRRCSFYITRLSGVLIFSNVLPAL